MPDHVLICPIGHFESTVKLAEVMIKVYYLHSFIVFIVCLSVCVLKSNKTHFISFAGCSYGN